MDKLRRLTRRFHKSARSGRDGPRPNSLFSAYLAAGDPIETASHGADGESGPGITSLPSRLDSSSALRTINHRTSSNLYTPLNLERYETRLLFIPASGQGSDVDIKLVTVSLAKNPVFTALSYVWGDPKINRLVRVNGELCRVTESLFLALRQISRMASMEDGPHHRENEGQGARSASEQSSRLSQEWQTEDGEDLARCRGVYVWADALCINQNDVGERNHQVRLMQAIYSSATRVICWLGDDSVTKRALTAIQLLGGHVRANGRYDPECARDVSWLEKYPHMCDANNFLFYRDTAPEMICNAHWDAIAQLGENPYFTRVWIVQEVVLARTVWFVGSDQVLAEDTLWDFIRWLRATHAHRPPEPAQIGDHLWQRIITETDMFCTRIRKLRGLRLTRRQPGQQQKGEEQDHFLGSAVGTSLSNGSHQAETIPVFRAMDLRCTEPRDKIYGLLGLSAAINVMPDYTKPVSDVYVDFFTGFVERCGRLNNFLGLAGRGFFGDITPALDLQLPSWVPNLFAIAEAHNDDQPSLAVAPMVTEDDLVGAGGRWPSAVCSEPPSVEDGVLTVSGAILASVSILGAREADIRTYLTEEIADPPERRPRLRVLYRLLLWHVIWITRNAHSAFDISAADFYQYIPSFLRYVAFGNGGAISTYGTYAWSRSIWVTEARQSPLSIGIHADGNIAAQLSDRLFGDIPFPSPPGWQSLTVTDLLSLTTKEQAGVWNTFITIVDNTLRKYRVFQTHNGYLGLGIGDINVSDSVMVIPGYVYPVIVRQSFGGWIYVSSCMVTGIMVI